MLKRLKKYWQKQRGIFSPFMFGLLAGVSIFSLAMRTQAQIELKRVQEQQQNRASQQMQAMRDAVENALMTETTSSYGLINAAELAKSSALSSGGTRDKQGLVVGSITTDGATDSQRIMVSTSDDAFVRAEVTSLAGGTANNMASATINARSDVASIDTTALRSKQIKLSMQNMTQQANMVYAWYAQDGHLRFPTTAEYSSDIASSGLKDFWGGVFTYTRTNVNLAKLTFTPPWGGTPYAITMNLQ